jgi:L-iditol 2-dehydrogenase
MKLAKASGATRIVATDINEYRLHAAKNIGGADIVTHASNLTPESLRAANDGRLADFVVVCAGAKAAVEQAFKCVERGGTILLFALLPPGDTVPFPLWEIWRDNVKLVTAYASPPKDTITAIDLIASHRISVTDMITHRLPLERAAEGFKLTAEAKDAIKVILLPQEKL